MTTVRQQHGSSGDHGILGAPLERIEGPDKVTGRARYGFEHAVDGALYGWVVLSTIPAGEVVRVDTDAVTSQPGVVGVVWHGNAPQLQSAPDIELQVLQTGQVAYAGQAVAVVVARSLEAARAGADALRVEYRAADATTTLRADDPALYVPEALNAGFPAETDEGDVDAALQDAAFVVDRTYTTPPFHNAAMEPHAAVAVWEADDRLSLWNSTQNSSEVAKTVATLFGLDAGAVVVHSPHVGGGFGAKGSTKPEAVLAALAARTVGAPVKISLTRQMTFSMVGYRTPTIQHVRLGADADGRLVAIDHHTVEQTSQLMEFAEQTGESTRHMYAAPNRRVTHQLSRLNVPTPRWMRAPGEAPGMYAVEVAMDELARAVGLDPIELRVRNEPAVDPDSGNPWSSRHYLDCFREGARRFGWGEPFERKVGRVRVGHGVAGSVYPAYLMPSSARVEAYADGGFGVSLAAADIGTGARTVLRQIAADALGVTVDSVQIHIGDSSLPRASGAGGSAGTASWGYAVTKACTSLRRELGKRDGVPREGFSVEENTADEVKARGTTPFARFAFGAQFVEVHVDVDTGEVRVPRAVGVFATGRILNARTARSQFLGGMTMGLGMGLMEQGVWDARRGVTVNDDFASYHVPANADIGDLDVSWLDEDDTELNPMGSKGIGEIGIVGTAAALSNAVFDATGTRVRSLPITLEDLL